MAPVTRYRLDPACGVLPLALCGREDLTAMAKSVRPTVLAARDPNQAIGHRDRPAWLSHTERAYAWNRIPAPDRPG
jgi:hypothetical protein